MAKSVPAAAHGARYRPLSLDELVEDQALIFFGDANAIVGHLEADHRLLGIQEGARIHMAACRGVLDGVGSQVHENVQEFLLISEEQWHFFAGGDG